MEKAKVYFTDFRVQVGTSLLQKLRTLCLAAGFRRIDMDGKFVAIKMHFGELGNMAFLRPQYAKVLADLVKEQGGVPFLTDCNTLYPGSRKHALEHMDCANLNGFNPTTTGCQIIIGDGLKGTDDVEVPVKNGEYVKAAKIGRAVMDADVFISLAHFKGHEMTGFGGAIKNIGMGCGSRAGKMEQHSSGKCVVDEELCRGCRKCAKECGSQAITYENNKAHIHKDLCKGCGRCIGACSFSAIRNEQWDAGDLLDKKMAEYAQAVVQDRPCFHVNLAMDISPNCDCHGEMMRRFSRIWGCLRPLTRSRWIRPAQTPARRRLRWRTASCRIIWISRTGIIIMMSFWTAIPTCIGRRRWNMRKKSAWARVPMSWSC